MHLPNEIKPDNTIDGNEDNPYDRIQQSISPTRYQASPYQYNRRQQEMQDYSKSVGHTVKVFQNPREHSHQPAHHKEG